MRKDPKGVALALKGKHTFEQSKQAPDTEISPKPGNSTLVAKTICQTRREASPFFRDKSKNMYI